MSASAEGIRRTSANGDPVYRKMVDQGVDRALETAVDELADFPATPAPSTFHNWHPLRAEIVDDLTVRLGGGRRRYFW